MLLERVADDLGLEEMVKAVRVKAMAETGRPWQRRLLKEKKHNEISDKLDTIILALQAMGSNSQGSRGPNPLPEIPFPFPEPDPDFIWNQPKYFALGDWNGNRSTTIILSNLM